MKKTAESILEDIKSLIEIDINALKTYAKLLKTDISMNTRAKLITIDRICLGVLERLDTVAEYEASKENLELSEMLNKDIEKESDKDNRMFA